MRPIEESGRLDEYDKRIKNQKEGESMKGYESTNEKMTFPEFYEKLFGIKLNYYQKKILEDYYQNSNIKFIYLPLRDGRTYIDILCAVSKAWYGLYEEGEIEFDDQRLAP